MTLAGEELADLRLAQFCETHHVFLLVFMPLHVCPDARQGLNNSRVYGLLSDWHNGIYYGILRACVTPPAD